MDSGEPQIKEEMSHRSTRVAISWYPYLSYLSFPELAVDEGIFGQSPSRTN